MSRIDDFKEFKLKPFALKSFFKPTRYFYTHMLTYRQDLLTLVNWHLFRRQNNTVSMGVPKEMMVVPSTICNGRCVFCSYRKLTEHGSIMPKELYESVIDQYAELGGKRISLCPTVGECLVDPQIFEKITYAKQKGISPYTFTNGILLLTNDNYKKLVVSGLDDLFISIGDIVPEVEAEVFGIPLAVAQKKIDGILALLKEMEEKKPKMTLTLGFRSKRKFSEIWKDMKKLGMDKHFKAKRFKIGYVLGYDNWGGSITQAELLGLQTLKRTVAVKKYPCAKLHYVSVLPDGTVRLCGCRVKDTMKDGLVIGSVKQNSLKEILANGNTEKIAQSFINGSPPEICKECSFYVPKFK